MHRIYRKLKKINKVSSNEVFKGISILVKGSVLARFFGIISIPILTRLYSPDAYGTLALYVAAIAILSPIVSFRYVQAIPLPRKDVAALNIFFLCLISIFFCLIVLILIFVFYGKEVFSWFDYKILYDYWPLIILGVAGTSLYELLGIWATRKRQYKTLADAQVIQSVIGNMFKILFGFIGFKSVGLLFGHFFLQSSGVLRLLRNFCNDFKCHCCKVNLRRVFVVAKMYRGYPIYRLPSHFLMALSVQAPILMMSIIYKDKGAVGQLSLAMTALSLPVSMIGAAVSKAYYGEIANIGKNNIALIKKITWDLQKKLFLVSVPFTIAAVFFSESLFVFAFGLEWQFAGKFAGILAPFMLFQFTSAPLMEVINIVGSQVNFLIIHVVRALGFLVIYWLFRRYDIPVVDFVIVLSAYLSFFYLFSSIFVFNILAKKSSGNA